MRFGWVLSVVLLSSLSFAKDSTRPEVVSGLVRDFVEWNQVAPTKLTELCRKKPLAEADRMMRAHFMRFFESSTNSQISEEPSSAELRAVLSELASRGFPFNPELIAAPYYKKRPAHQAQAPAPKKKTPPATAKTPNWTLELPKFTWFLPSPENVSPDGHGGFITVARKRSAERDKAQRQLEADQQDLCDAKHFYFDPGQSTIFLLNEKVETEDDFLRVLELYTHLDTGRVLLESITGFGSRTSTALTPLRLIRNQNKFRIRAEPEEGSYFGKSHSLRPEPSVSVLMFDDDSVGIYFKKGSEFGQLLLDLSYALTVNGPSGEDRFERVLYPSETPVVNVERALENSGIDPKRLNDGDAKETHRAMQTPSALRVAGNHRVWEETAKRALHSEALFLQHTLYEELMALTDSRFGKTKVLAVDSYFEHLEKEGIVPIVRREVTDSEVGTALGLKNLDNQDVDLSTCLGHLKTLLFRQSLENL